jgi:hypothetical protein
MSWLVLDYKHPTIRVKNEVSGEIAPLYVNDDGSLFHDGARFDLGDARRAAIEYLASILHPREVSDQPRI